MNIKHLVIRFFVLTSLLALSACTKTTSAQIAQDSPSQVPAGVSIAPSLPQDSEPAALGSGVRWEYALVNLVTCPIVGKTTTSQNLSLTDDASPALLYDLQDADLAGANLQAADLRWANLQGANLSNVNLRSALLSGADLRNARLSDTMLNDATTLPYSVFGGAVLAGANLAGQDLSGKDLREVDLSHADLSGTDLRGTIFGSISDTGDYYHHADLDGAILKDATLDSNTRIDPKFRLIAELQTAGKAPSAMRNSDLRSADLRGVDLSQVDLTQANLTGADLRSVKLTEANLASTNLSSADLRGADLSGAVLEGANLSYANVDATTKIDPKWLLVWQAKNSMLSERVTDKQPDGSAKEEEDLLQKISIAALLGTDCLNDDVGFFRSTDQITELNRLGREGWEVSSIRRLYSENLYEGVEVYLKRVLTK